MFKVLLCPKLVESGNHKLRKAALFLISFIFISLPVFSHSLKLGLSFSGGFAAGDANKIFYGNAGGGIDAEYEIFPSFGVSSSVDFYRSIPKDNRISFASSLDFLLGAWYRFDFGHSGFALQPSVNSGVCFEKAVADIPSYSSSIYTDFILKPELSLRYSNSKIAGGNLEFALTPYANIIPQKDALSIYAGASLGLLYRFDFNGGRK